MKEKPSSRRKRSSAKSVLRLPDLEHAKAAVLAWPCMVNEVAGCDYPVSGKFCDAAKFT
jgi:hypothetical protein